MAPPLAPFKAVCSAFFSLYSVANVECFILEGACFWAVFIAVLSKHQVTQSQWKQYPLWSLKFYPLVLRKLNVCGCRKWRKLMWFLSVSFPCFHNNYLVFAASFALVSLVLINVSHSCSLQLHSINANSSTGFQWFIFSWLNGGISP